MTRRALDALPAPEGRRLRAVWAAVPREGSGEPETVWASMQEARAAARLGGYGWKVEGRRVEVVEDEDGV